MELVSGFSISLLVFSVVLQDGMVHGQEPTVMVPTESDMTTVTMETEPATNAATEESSTVTTATTIEPATNAATEESSTVTTATTIGLYPDTLVNGIVTTFTDSAGDTIVRYSCNNGFELVWIVEATSTVKPICYPLCPVPLVRNGSVNFTGFISIGDNATFSCDSGHELVGDQESTCTMSDANTATFSQTPFCRHLVTTFSGRCSETNLNVQMQVLTATCSSSLLGATASLVCTPDAICNLTFMSSDLLRSNLTNISCDFERTDLNVSVYCSNTTDELSTREIIGIAVAAAVLGVILILILLCCCCCCCICCAKKKDDEHAEIIHLEARADLEMDDVEEIEKEESPPAKLVTVASASTRNFDEDKQKKDGDDNDPPGKGETKSADSGQD